MKPLTLKEWKTQKEIKEWIINIEFSFDLLNEYTNFTDAMPKDEWLEQIIFARYERYLDGFNTKEK